MFSGAIDYLERGRRVHALLLTCACAVLLFPRVPFREHAWGTFNWSTPDSTRAENELDSLLQTAAEDALRQREGAIIIMDAQTGRVRAAVNLEATYAQAMMPGSTIKPFTTLAALRAGLIDEDSRTVCPGRFTGLSFSLPCVHANHLPPFTPSQSIAHSCNYYFATVGQRLGRDRLVETLRPFGFGQATGLDQGEAIGMIKPCETGNRARIRSNASEEASQVTDCIAREALGESNHIQVTPIQLLTAYAALLNGGHLYQPQTGSADAFQIRERAQIHISTGERRIISEGMAGAVRYGTARKARLDSMPIYVLGKTGTALPSKGFRTNGWFVGLAGPSQADREADPHEIQLAVLVFLPRAHGADAAALSRPIFDAYANALRRGNTAVQHDIEPANKPRIEGSLSSSQIKVRHVSTNVTRELSMEDYVLGVMQAEGSMESEPEALKALAITIRSYAVKNRGRHAKDGYDFCSTTHCQRFGAGGPTARESRRVGMADARASETMVQAVRSTIGQVLHDQREQPADVYFGASCGGETANIGSLWGSNPPSHLRGVQDEFCLTGPHARWTDVIAREDLLRALRSDARTDIGARLDGVTVTKHDETGRAEFVALEGEQHKIIRGWDFKIIVGRALGWNVLKSSRFKVSRMGSNFVFRGTGFGHGLGLCQEGAHVMAARGANYQRILEKYFPGTRVARDSEIRSRRETASSSASERWKADVASTAGFFAASPRPTISASGSDRFLTISSEHFRVTYPADVSRRDADQVLTVLESSRADFLRRAAAASISTAGFPNIEVRLNNSTGDFTSRTGQPWWAAAATKGNRIELQPHAILKRRGVVTSTLRHELAHVIINLVSRNRAPRWLEEGFAIYLAGEGRHFSNHVPRGVLLTDELERRLERPRTQAEMRSLYAQAHLTVSAMVRNEGEANVWKKLAGS